MAWSFLKLRKNSNKEKHWCIDPQVIYHDKSCVFII